MNAGLYLAFAAASALLILMPGPNVALIVANSLAHGLRLGLMTVFGTACATVVQLVLTVLGLVTAQVLFARGFAALRWLGVAYLLYLAWRNWTAEPAALDRIRAEPRSSGRIFLRGFLVSLTNPKTLIFYGAFFPQFISPAAPALPQSILLAVTFLVIALAFDSGWALLAARLRGFLHRHARWRQRITGGLLAGAGLGLALARRS